MNCLQRIFFFGQPGLSKAERLRLLYLLMFITDGVRRKNGSKVPTLDIIKRIVDSKKYTALQEVFTSLSQVIEIMISDSVDKSPVPAEPGLTAANAIKEAAGLMDHLLPF